ncbi:hypothetical protein DL96DRAFT_1571870 [Flagelloscypha sp. PMI_526]|nr:hypothetical protein DL96DRAFT_1571870 [Flagelloscypha sp. PMI_526]
MDSSVTVTAESLLALQTALDDGLIPYSEQDVTQAEESVLQAEGSKKKMQELLEKLQSHVEHLEHFIQLQHAFIHPLRRLPTEILREIIGWCLVAERTCPTLTDVLSSMGRPASPDLPLAWSSVPLRLSHVSRSWRAFLHSRPELWASVSVEVKKHHTPDFLQRGYHLLGIHLQNSKTHPLDVGITIHPGVPRRLARMLPAHITGLLVSQQARWKNCTLNMAPLDFNKLFTGQEVFPLLSHLTLAFSPALASSNLAFVRAPSLTYLSVTGVENLEAFDSLAIPLHLIEKLVLDLRLMRLLFCAGSTLSHVCFDGLSANSEPEPVPFPIAIPANVTSVTFRSSKISMAKIFNNLILPSELHTLTIAVHNAWEQETTQAFFGMLTGSYSMGKGCPVRRVTIGGLYLSVLEIRSLLYLFPSLLELELSDLHCGLTLEALFKILLPFHLDRFPNPMLRKIQIQGGSGLRDCGESIVTVTQSLHRFLKDRLALTTWDNNACSVAVVEILFGMDYNSRHTVFEVVHDARVTITDRIYT